ncbi:peptide chain release factor 1 [Candidatus Malacoplasma girerdii]|uniref:Peptide chain release factor 1 n=1 Tax=Candidatus Malacoplasma girerdii TaxID=1318617 RepID=A0A097ST08_9BACT|nr:peptide chain release factor 1 [Candidatus Malacoplasma girerdii]ASJ89250.1 MAG: peptide chain release factor 1 [Candidatus Malacoplasma girerdii]
MEFDKNLYQSLEAIVKQYNELNDKVESGTLGIHELKEVNRAIKRNKPIYDKFLIYQKLIDDGIQDEKVLNEGGDNELINLAKMELEDIKNQIPAIEDELKILLIPQDPNNDKDVIVEMRPGVGGDESCIFVVDLFECYKRYADKQGWKIKVNSSSYNAHGCDYIFFSISGEEVYSKFKYESGVHRVQRVPLTETKGRVHTSTITVAVLPEVDPVEFTINPSDLRIDTYRAGGAGGQHVNRTESAVRITHLPTNVVVACQDGRSQIENRETAMNLLRAKLYNKYLEEQQNEVSSLRKSQVGNGERSEKIRTYNYPQNRVTDHRIGLTLNKLDYVMMGNLDEIVNGLIANEQEEKLSQLKNS